MKISVALATYNGEKYLKQQLDSLLSQTVLPDELVVCDDNSTDETMSLLISFKKDAPFKMQIFKNESNLGFNKNFEKVISLCTGDLIFLCDQDDFWFSDKLKFISEFIKNEKLISHLYINDALYTDIELKKLKTTIFERTRQYSGQYHLPVNGACSVITKEFRDFLIPFPEDLQINYDTHIHKWGHMLDSRRSIEKVLQVWRLHGKNATSNEMSAPRFTSLYKLYKRYRTKEASEAYISYRKDLETMLFTIENRQDLLYKLFLVRSNSEISKSIEKIIGSYNNRIELLNEKFLAQKTSAIAMLMRGDYKYFNGFRSFLKDIFR